MMGVLRALSSRPVEPARLRLVPSSLWAVRQLRASVPALIRQWPGLVEVRINLSLIDNLDQPSALNLKEVVAIASRATISIALDGCSAAAEQLLLSNGVDASCIGLRSNRP